MANKRQCGSKMVEKMFKIVVALNVLCQFCPCRTSVDIGGQSFIQTDGELRYVVDSGVPFHLTTGQAIQELSVAASLVRFDPPLLDFGDQPVGMPHTEQVMVHNLDAHGSLHLLSISGSTSHFHCSFFLEKLVPPLQNTTFEVVFLARQVGSIENTLYIHSSKGSFKYQVSGVGIQNPYRIRPFLGAKVPVNSSFSPVISMYNPHGTVLQVEEIYTSGGDLHLELPTGEREASRELWEIPPFETKAIMKASFIGRVESNHTAFIRIRTNKENKQQMLIVPVEVEVTSAPGIFSLLEMLDFGLLRTMDDPAVLRLNVINSGMKPIHIVNITLQPPNPAVHVDFRPIQIKPDIFHPTSIASISFTASKVATMKQCSGKIVVKSKNSVHKLTIPYQSSVLHGSLVYDGSQMLFYTGDMKSGSFSSTTHAISITNTFNVTIVVYNIVLAPSSRDMFTITNFSRPCMLHPQQTISLFNITFHTNITMPHFTTDVYLHTNTSVYKIPLYVYHGRLKVVHHRPEISKGQLDFGTLAMGEKRTMNFTLRNDNPVDIIISKFVCNMGGTAIQLLGIEQGNGTMLSQSYDISSIATDPLILKPFHIAVFSVEVTAPEQEGAFSAEVIFTTQFEHLYIPVTLRTAEGSLNVVPDKLVLRKCFPGRLSTFPLHVHSSFTHPLEVRSVTFSPNSSLFRYIPIKEKSVVIGASQETLIGHIQFDPRRECRDDCYVSLPTHIPAGHTWLLGSKLDHEVTDTDQYLFTRFSQKWDEIGISQQSTINVTVQLDTNKVCGFLFPAQAQLTWPSLTRSSTIRFPLTQIGNISLSEFVLENPADVPAVVQLVPLSVYPNAQSLLDIIPSLIPPDIVSDLVTGASDDDGDVDVFTLSSLSEPVASGSDTASVSHFRRAAETMLGMRPSPRTVALLMPAKSKVSVPVVFEPRDELLHTSLIIIRNNLTIIDVVTVQGQGGYGDLRFSNRKPGSQKPLTFEMSDKQLKQCDKRIYSSSRNIPPSFTVRRTFTVRNTGPLPVYIDKLMIGDAKCEGYGFKVIDCTSFDLLPNDSHKVDIIFAPDFTMSRIRQTLTLQTSLGAVPLNFTLQATIPANALSLCAATLPRPAWEPLLYYATVLSMGFLLFCVMVAAYFEADRISVADIIRRRAEMSHAATMFEKGRMFDLRSLSRSGLSHGVCDADVTVKNGSATSAFGQLSVKARSSTSEAATNGHVPFSKMLSSGDGQRSSHLSFFERLWASRSRTPSALTPPPGETAVWTLDHKSGATSGSASGNSRRWNPAWLGVSVFGAVLRQVRWLAEKLTSPSSTAVCTKSTSTGEDSPPASSWTDKRLSAVASCESAPCRDVDDRDYVMVVPKPDAKILHQRREKSVNDQVYTSGSCEPPSKTALGVGSSGSAKHGKVKKLKAGDIRRLKEKLIENEKLADKDETSSTTTETSSIEADDKIVSPQDLSEVSTKQKKSSGKGKPDSPKVESSADLPLPSSDEFIPAPPKARGKKRPETAVAKPSSLELPYTIKRSGDSVPSKDGNRAKKPISPPPTLAAASGTAATVQRRKSASKGKSSDLSDLAAQTDAFVRAHRPLTGREGPNTRSTASSPTIPSQTNRPSSYSSVVSSAARTSSPDQMPSTMSGTAKPSVTTVSSFGVDAGHRSSGAGPATGRAAGSGRPVAAVGAVRRPEWSNANSGGGSTAGNDEVLVDTSAQCRPFPMMSGVPYSGNQASMLMADGDATLPGSSLLLNSGCFLPPPMTDDALLASLTAANSASLYPVDGYGSLAEQQQQVTFMQKLQAERRRRLLEYQQRKRLEAENGWPGFDVSITEPVESIWERTGNAQLGAGNPWTSYPLPSNQQSGKTSAAPAASSNFWNQPPATWSTGPSYSIWGGESASADQRSPAGNAAEPAEDGGADGTAIFDPFNSLEMNHSIWNPNNTNGSSGMSGWTFSSAGPRSDN